MKKWHWSLLVAALLCGGGVFLMLGKFRVREHSNGDATPTDRSSTAPNRTILADPLRNASGTPNIGTSTNPARIATDPSRIVMRHMPGETGAAPIRVTARFRETPWTPQINRMQDAMDEGDSDGALTAARELINVPNIDARRAAVDLFRWIGPKALPELTRMLVDAEEELAELALEGWQMALGEITDHTATMREAANAVVAIQDEYARHAFMMEISLLPDDIAAGYYTCMLDVQDRRVVELALEYMTFMAQEPIENKDDAARWMARIKAEAAAEAAREKAIEDKVRP